MIYLSWSVDDRWEMGHGTCQMYDIASNAVGTGTDVEHCPCGIGTLFSRHSLVALLLHWLFLIADLVALTPIFIPTIGWMGIFLL